MLDPVALHQAASAYGKASSVVDDAAKPEASGIVSAFSEMVKSAASGTVDSLKGAEQLATLSAAGNKVDLNELVVALSNAELALSTIVSIRDKAISAYQDIIKMPI